VVEPCYEIEVILNRHSRYILPHTLIEVFSKVITWLRLKVEYIWENRLTHFGVSFIRIPYFKYFLPTGSFDSQCHKK